MLKTLTVYNSGNAESKAIRDELFAQPTYDKEEININGMSSRDIDNAIAALTDTFDIIYICVYSSGTFTSGKVTTAHETALDALLNAAPMTGQRFKQRRPTNKIDDFMPHYIHRSSSELPFIMQNLFNQNLL